MSCRSPCPRAAPVRRSRGVPLPGCRLAHARGVLMRLGPCALSRIRAVVQGLGLSFYGDADGPDEARLYVPDLAARLHAMGSEQR